MCAVHRAPAQLLRQLEAFLDKLSPQPEHRVSIYFDNGLAVRIPGGHRIHADISLGSTSRQCQTDCGRTVAGIAQYPLQRRSPSRLGMDDVGVVHRIPPLYLGCDVMIRDEKPQEAISATQRLAAPID
jgi:hypothetical protein